MQLLQSFEEDCFQMWHLSISKKMTQSLNRPLIVRDQEHGTIRVNLGRDLMSVLREASSLYVVNSPRLRSKKRGEHHNFSHEYFTMMTLNY